jgi:hypothetical protein
MDKFTEKTNEFLRLIDEKSLVYTARGKASEEDAETIASPLDKKGALTDQDESNIKNAKIAQRLARDAENAPTREEQDAKKKINMLAAKLGQNATAALSKLANIK